SRHYASTDGGIGSAARNRMASSTVRSSRCRGSSSVTVRLLVPARLPAHLDLAEQRGLGQRDPALPVELEHREEPDHDVDALATPFDEVPEAGFGPSGQALTHRLERL